MLDLFHRTRSSSVLLTSLLHGAQRTYLSRTVSLEELDGLHCDVSESCVHDVLWEVLCALRHERVGAIAKDLLAVECPGVHDVSSVEVAARVVLERTQEREVACELACYEPEFCVDHVFLSLGKKKRAIVNTRFFAYVAMLQYRSVLHGSMRNRLRTKTWRRRACSKSVHLSRPPGSASPAGDQPVISPICW